MINACVSITRLNTKLFFSTDISLALLSFTFNVLVRYCFFYGHYQGHGHDHGHGHRS